MRMMRKIKKWFLDYFLPMWAKETVMVENRRLLEAVNRLQHELEIKNAYIAGLVAGQKSLRRIIINATEEKK